MGKLIRLEFITHLAALLVGGLLFGALGWFFQEARLGVDAAEARAEAAQYKSDVATERGLAQIRVRQAEGAANAKWEKALSEAGVRERALRDSRRALERTAAGLQQQLDAAEQRLATATREAAIEYGVAVNRVLGVCKARYGRLAELADGHASDVRTCRDAWPDFGPAAAGGAQLLREPERVTEP